ncbi:MAG: hypothetical protein MPN21_03670 [Thermoanaerobaculia bacterium]|nr:hypothetical protein [Thermoanaerobaculia bacterium]
MNQPTAMPFPPELFQLRQDTNSVRSVIDQLQPLGLQWQVEEDADRDRVRALAPLFVDSEAGEIWAVAAVENWGSPRHEHNDGGIYGELVITMAGALDDVTDDGRAVQCLPGTVLWHAGGTVHQATGEFWVGIYHQPRGSTPRPIEDDPDTL